MPSEEIQRLIGAFVDDRDGLTDEQYRQLLAAAREDVNVLRQLKSQLALDESLAQLMAVDRADFPAQLAQRVRDLDRDDDLQQQVREMRELAAQDYAPAPRRRGVGRWMLAATLLLAVGAASWYVLPGVNDQPRVVRVFGQVTLLRSSGKTTLQANDERLRSGDRVLTGDRAFAVLEYRDGTRVSLASGSLMEIDTKFRGGKTMHVERGAVAAVVAPQPAARPMRFITPRADAQVVGTELLLEVSSQQTRLNVAEGKVELRGLGSDQALLVGRRQFAVTDGGDAELQSLVWPASGERLHVLVEPGETQPAEFETRGNVGWDQFIKFRGGSLLLPDALGKRLTESCRESEELTVELLLRCDSSHLSGPARIVTLSKDAYSRNFTVGQEREHLVFRLRTTTTGENGTNPELRLCRIADRDLHHLVVCWQRGELTCYLDGERVMQSDRLGGDLSNWSDHYLTLGDEWQTGPRSGTWRGELHAVAIYARTLAGEEVLRNFAALSPH
ncbi:MAG: FecR domain-containing protein [Planctomycetales bacterium]|nr:FecR domain-containing protein [Planctomycetales bacterium]